MGGCSPTTCIVGGRSRTGSPTRRTTRVLPISGAVTGATTGASAAGVTTDAAGVTDPPSWSRCSAPAAEDRDEDDGEEAVVEDGVGVDAGDSAAGSRWTSGADGVNERTLVAGAELAASGRTGIVGSGGVDAATGADDPGGSGWLDDSGSRCTAGRSGTGSGSGSGRTAYAIGAAAPEARTPCRERTSPPVIPAGASGDRS
jgi:hypothetical protein